MAALVFFAATTRAQSSSRPDDWAAVSGAIGRSGAVQSDGAMKYGFPRSDLKVTVAGAANAVETKEPGLDVFRRQPDGIWKIVRYVAYEEP